MQLLQLSKIHWQIGKAWAFMLSMAFATSSVVTTFGMPSGTGECGNSMLDISLK